MTEGEAQPQSTSATRAELANILDDQVPEQEDATAQALYGEPPRERRG